MKTLEVLDMYRENFRNIHSLNSKKNTRLMISIIKRVPGIEELDIADVDYKFRDTFVSGLLDGSLTARGKPLANTTISLYLTILVQVMKWARVKGYHDTRHYEDFHYLTPMRKISKEPVILSEKEIELFQNIDRSNFGKLTDKVWRMFVFCLETGQRISDLESIVKSSIIHYPDLKGNYLVYNSQKKCGRVMVRVSNKALSVIDSDGDRIFNNIPSKKTIMIYLRRLIVEAKISRDVTQTTFSGSSMERKVLHISEVIGFHDARHTFAHHHLMNGGSMETLLLCLGHKNMITTQNYIRNYHSQYFLKQK